MITPIVESHTFSNDFEKKNCCLFFT